MAGPKTEFLRRSEAEAGVRAAPVGPKAIAGGSAVVALTGLGAVLLSIIGLSGAAPATVDSAAIVALGAAILLGGGAYLARIARVPGAADVRGWFSAESFLGAAGVALAVIALLAGNVLTLNALGALALALAFLCGGIGLGRLGRLGEEAREEVGTPRRVAGTAAGLHLACGAVGAVLAFLALIGPTPRTLTEVAVLVMGACAFFAGSVLAARLAAALARRA
jgi:hypothetical protein